MRIYTDEFMLRHDTGAGHPERSGRLESLLTSLAREPIAGVQVLSPGKATWEQIQRVHDSAYVDQVRALEGQVTQLDTDTCLSEDSVQAACLAAGAGIDAVEAVMNGDCQRAFALVRPPGHHAERDHAMGYCVFNNIAIATEHALASSSLERVLIVDWDVHHGNGTAHIFDQRADVLVFNTHQWPLYPGTGLAAETGSAAGSGLTINVPLPAGSGDADYEIAFRERLLPAAAKFQPQLVMISAGFDAHALDPLGSMQVTDEGFAKLARMVCDIADEHAQGRVVAMLEGGYDLDGLTGGVRATIEALV